MRKDNIDTLYALATNRKTYFQPDLDVYEKHALRGRAREHPTPGHEANLISSELRPGVHLPVIDCDFPVQVIASSTPGHCHLYIDQELTWEQYKVLLDGFLAAGLIQAAWYENAVRDKRTYVRLPHVRKPSKEPATVQLPQNYPF